MVDIYADEGITGTSTAKREDFRRMMADCRRGLIDQILVKSISRFARNTKDCLEAVRELKELGVNVRFEREGIDTANVSSELITAIYAAFTQKESESISGNMRWSYQRRMEAGTFLPSSMAYGYKLVGRKIEIDADAALVICRIFQWYLNGVNRIAIAKMLNEEGISSGQRKNGTVPLSDTSSPTKNTQEIPCGKKPTPAIHFLRPATKTPVSMNSITQ